MITKVVSGEDAETLDRVASAYAAIIDAVAPELLATDYGLEIWELYQRGALQVDTPLTGRFERRTAPVDMGSVLREIDDARAEEAARRVRMQVPG